jgi:hypothetical protein
VLVAVLNQGCIKRDDRTLFFNLAKSDDSFSKPLNGKGAFFYVEPVTIHTSDPLLGRPPVGIPGDMRREIRIKTEVHNIGRIMVTDDGFVCLFVEDQKTIDFLNTLFASANILWGIQGYVARLEELCNFEVVPDTNYIKIVGYTEIERNILSLQRDGDDRAFEIWKNSHRRLITPSMMEQTINFADKVLSNKDLYMDLVLLFDGLTLKYRGAYTAAYLYSWMMIETFLGKIWNEYVDSMDRSRRDKASLKDHNRWTTYHHIEMLSAVSKMDDATRDLMHRLRQKRNSIIHERRQVSESDARDCLLVADKVLRNRFNDPKTPFLNIS